MNRLFPMKAVHRRPARSLLLPLLALALATGALPAQAGSRDAYARQWSLLLAQPGAGAYRVPLDEAVYRSAGDHGLADVDVFNAAGQALPAAVLAAERPAAQAPRTQPLPWFPLPVQDPGAGGADLRLLAERDASGGIVRIEAAARAGAPVASGGQWRVDASRLAEAPRALRLDWKAPLAPLQAGYRVEGSDDLRQWRTLNAGTTLLDLEREGQRLRQGRIELDGRARYLRLLPLRPGNGPELASVAAELAPSAAPVLWQWLEIEGERRREGGREVYEFVLPGRFPVARADVALAANSAVDWTLHSREDTDAAWTWRAGPWMAWRLEDGGPSARRSEPAVLSSVVRDRHWRLSASTPVGEAVPVLRLGYRPEVLVFLAQGAPPYALAAGSARARREAAPIPALLDALRRQHGPDWQPAAATLAGTAQELAGEQAMQAPRAHDWRAWLLWSLLIGGALLVALLGLSLLRQRGEH